MLPFRNWWTSSTIGGRISGLLRTIAAIAVIGIGVWLLVKGAPRALAYFQNDGKDSVTVPTEAANTVTKNDSSSVIPLLPAPKYCDVTDSTKTFCSSNAQVIRIIEAGDLLLLNPGTAHICTKKPIVNITYKVAMNDRLRFTSALDLENTRCDIFVVTRVPR